MSFLQFKAIFDVFPFPILDVFGHLENCFLSLALASVNSKYTKLEEGSFTRENNTCDQIIPPKIIKKCYIVSTFIIFSSVCLFWS